jgi:exopolysaccharide biosynthesis protein
MKMMKAVAFVFFNLILFVCLAPFVIFYGPFDSLKQFSVGTIMTSRHPQVVEFFLSKAQIDEFYASYHQKRTSIEPVILSKEHVMIDPINGIRMEEINGKYFKGKVMLVNNAQQIRVAVTSELGTAGQRLSEFVRNNGAVAGINAGGFYDPNAQGNGAYPDGITVVNNVLIHNRVGANPVNLIGFDDHGKLVLGKMSVKDLQDNHIRHAVSFYPNLLTDGKPLIKGDGGWGLAPRTGIGQTPDGTVVFVVIDGRQPGWSMGATLRDLMNVFVEYGAENAANLDGGSSAEMVYQGKIVNSLWNIYGERYIPTAFLVLPKDNLELMER